MWTVVYLANSTDLKNNICSLLEENGILRRAEKIEASDVGADVCYNILVPAAEVGAAHALILDTEL